MIVLKIRNGTYFNECLIHCNEMVTITAEKTFYALTSNVQDTEKPDIIEEMQTTEEQFGELQLLIDWNKVKALSSIIGQPDATDQGGEWVEITVDGDVKRIDFEMNASVSGIDILLKNLRKIRNELSRKYRRQ